jgi:hypothetical protein
MRGTSRPYFWVHRIVSISPNTRCSRIPKKREGNVIEHHIAWTIKGSYTAVPHLATALEGRLEGKSDKQPQSGVAEENRVPEVCLLQRLHGNWRWMFWALLLQSSGERNRKPCLGRSMFIKHFFPPVLWCKITLCWHDCVFFVQPVYYQCCLYR